MKKQVVICDLNVWFALGRGELSEKEYSENIFVPTWVNLIELGYHPLLVEGSEYFMNASKKILENIGSLINEHPFLFLSKYASRNFSNGNETSIDKVIAELNFFSSEQTKNIPREVFFEKFEEQKKMYRSMSENLNIGLIETRKILDNNKERNNFLYKNKEEFKINAMKIWIMNLITTHSNGQVSNFENYPWESLELFMKVAGNFFDDAKLNDKMKIQDNDHNDFLNLVYVKKGNKYWTREKKWKSRIKKLGLEDYLFEE